MKRRKFLVATIGGTTAASLLTACGNPENKLIPALIPDEGSVPGIDYWKASTCALCPAGCGIIVRTREHKANKIEGNPAHPVNLGTLCARGQAGLQVLYGPDRVRGPLKLNGPRGSGQFAEISWDEAIKTLADKLREIKDRPDGSVMFATNETWGVTRFAAVRLKSALPRCTIVSEEAKNLVTLRAYAESYGRVGLPAFDIANTRYLLSFGARFLETWHSPAKYSLAYGEFRRAAGRPRGKFVQIEPRMSLTGANADEWLPLAPGTERLVALAIAQVIIREKLIKDATKPQFIDDYAPEKTAKQTDIAAEKIVRIAREFAASQPALAIADDAGILVNEAAGKAIERMDAINFLNVLVGNLNKPGGVLLPSKATRSVPETTKEALAARKQPQPLPPADYFDPLVKLREPERYFAEPFSLDEILAGNTPVGSPGALLLHGVNPAYGTPSLVEKIKSIPFIASFSSFRDESAQLADLILPDHSYLESWDLNATEMAEVDKAAQATSRYVVTLTAPAVKPEFNTRQTADVLLALSRELGGEEIKSLPLKSAEEVVKQAAGLLQKRKGSIGETTLDGFWKTLIERGVWVGETEDSPKSDDKPGTLNLEAFQPQSGATGAGTADYPLILLPYEHMVLGEGATANLPWLQELPDPMTTVMWGSWVEINPKTAAALGIADGDLVEVRSRDGAVQVPVVLYPAIRPDVVAMPLGQGHTAYGQFATNRGVNTALLLGSGREANPVRVRVSKQPGRANLVRFGTSLEERLLTKR